MNFSLRLALSIAVLVACTAVMGVTALLAMHRQHARLVLANERYEELRGLYEIGSRAATARLLLNADSPAIEDVRRQLLGAAQATDRLIQHVARAPEQRQSHLRATLENMRSGLEASLVGESPMGAGDRSQSPGASHAALNACLAQVATLSAEATQAIEADRLAIAHDVKRAQWTLGATLAITFVLALTLGLAQHRAIARPLLALRRGVERIGSRSLEVPIAESGPHEFRSLIRQVNDMNRDIRALEDSLHNQVETKSRQLIRSERLAGLGYLAAGLAHEINNPLGVISGYAETMLRRLEPPRRGDEPAGAAASSQETLNELADALRTISEEVFRCQDITTGLLQMTRHSDERMETIDLGALVERIANMLRRLPLCSDRRLIIEPCGALPLLARGHRGQLNQVIVNLITNALEATEPGVGEVRISIASQAGSALIRLRDNGCGMTAETLAHVFDPLFTDKPRRGLTGFGLGLSVSHAIIERHGGRIDASSDGPGCGSTFVIEVPALTAATSDAAWEHA